MIFRSTIPFSSNAITRRFAGLGGPNQARMPATGGFVPDVGRKLSRFYDPKPAIGLGLPVLVLTP
jgi:hypothetical protein